MALMRVIEIAAPGGPEVLRLAERPRPEAGPGEIVIRVAAAGVNRPDVFQRQGRYDPPPGASDLPGLEVAGEVAQVGPEVRQWKTGDRVAALVPGGGYADYARTSADHALPWPGTLSAAEAAALPEGLFTIWGNVFVRGRLAPGEVLLVHGGGSGIGTLAIRLARALGARVMVTAGSRAKCAACLGLGAEAAINYRESDFVAEVKGATAGRGADVILDMVAGDYLQRNLDALAPDGRLVLISSLGGAEARFNAARLMRLRQTITGSTLRPQSVAAKAELARSIRDKVWPLVVSGGLRPVIAATFPLAEAAAAHRQIESPANFGKVVLTA